MHNNQPDLIKSVCRVRDAHAKPLEVTCGLSVVHCHRNCDPNVVPTCHAVWIEDMGSALIYNGQGVFGAMPQLHLQASCLQVYS